MTPSQLAIFKAAILAETDPTIVAARNARIDSAIADWYNADADGPVAMWRNDITSAEMVEATVDNLAQYDNLSQGKRDAWSYVCALQTCDFTRNKIRSAPGKVWATTQRDAILSNPGTRNARRVEIAMGATDVTEGQVTAKKCSYIGTVTVNDVSYALNLP